MYNTKLKSVPLNFCLRTIPDRKVIKWFHLHKRWLCEESSVGIVNELKATRRITSKSYVNSNYRSQFKCINHSSCSELASSRHEQLKIVDMITENKHYTDEHWLPAPLVQKRMETTFINTVNAFHDLTMLEEACRIPSNEGPYSDQDNLNGNANINVRRTVSSHSNPYTGRVFFDPQQKMQIRNFLLGIPVRGIHSSRSRSVEVTSRRGENCKPRDKSVSSVQERHKETNNPSRDVSTTKELEAVEGRYPHPSGTLHNIYALVAQELKNPDLKLIPSYRMVPVHVGKSRETMWNCTYKLKWPEEGTFSAVMNTKSLASKQAALKALDWLQKQGKLTKTGAPLLHTSSESKQIKETGKLPTEIMLHSSFKNDMVTLVNMYRNNIEPLLFQLDADIANIDNSNGSETSSDIMDSRIGMNLEDIVGYNPTNPITGISVGEENIQDIARRSRVLYNRYQKRQNSESEYRESAETLPIFKLKSEIMELVDKNQVVVIKGEPGCGKSTQVPQYIMEQWESEERGGECNIIITQPRRISATSLAEWVALERGERLGDVVGYQVRLKAVIPKPPGGALLFCSTGILLRRLQNNPGLIGASHIIIDEAHERDINTDMLLVLLRQAVSLNPELRVIIMSATINAELFQEYFNNAPALHIPGFTYPVKSIFLDEIVGKKIKHYRLLKGSTVNCDLTADTVRWVEKNRPEGAILCFLPGWSEISYVAQLLEDDDNPNRLILPVHSRLSHMEQNRIFNKPPPDVRKIILATNIAETSITINDVKYVIDTGFHKEERMDIEKGISSLGCHFVSQANVNQRKGRAGRVQPGECYHLYTRVMYDDMVKFPIPEIHRVPLEKTVLDLKTYSSKKAQDVLSEMPEPPSQGAVIQAVEELIEIGALDEEEKLTPLGKRIATFSTHPKLSKALVHAAVFKCISPMLTVATILSGESDVFYGGLSNKEGIRLVKSNYDSSSDHVSLAQIYQEWQDKFQEREYKAIAFCKDKNLNHQNLFTVMKLRKLHSANLWKSRMLDDSDEYMELDGPTNVYSESPEILKAVFFSGTGTLLLRRNWDIKNGRLIKDTNVLLTESGQRAVVSSDSVNFKRKRYSSNYLTCFRQIESFERRAMMIRETSIVSPLCVVLFSEGPVTVLKCPPVDCREEDYSLIKVSRRKRHIVFLCRKDMAQELTELRVIVRNVINYFLLKKGIESDDERFQVVSGFRDLLLKTLAKMLFTSQLMADKEVEVNEQGSSDEEQESDEM